MGPLKMAERFFLNTENHVNVRRILRKDESAKRAEKAKMVEYVLIFNTDRILTYLNREIVQ